jgi:hypothetical protein
MEGAGKEAIRAYLEILTQNLFEGTVEDQGKLHSL